MTEYEENETLLPSGTVNVTKASTEEVLSRVGKSVTNKGLLIFFQRLWVTLLYGYCS